MITFIATASLFCQGYEENIDYKYFSVTKGSNASKSDTKNDTKIDIKKYLYLTYNGMEQDCFQNCIHKIYCKGSILGYLF
jgi:hypothetical protein